MRCGITTERSSVSSTSGCTGIPGLTELFQLFISEPECLPSEWRAAACGDAATTARTVADYLAGMTDRFALDEHRRLFDTYAGV